MPLLPHQRLTFTLFYHAIIGYGAFYYMSMLNPIQAQIEYFAYESVLNHYGHKLTDFELSWVWSVLSGSIVFGEFLGSIWVKYSADWGRKRTSMLLKNGVLILGAVLHWVAKWTASVEFLLVGRILTGVAIMQTFVLPMLLVEASPEDFRGLTGTLVNGLGSRLWVLIGTLAAIPQVLGNVPMWSLLVLLPIIPAVLHLLGVRYMPESPPHMARQLSACGTPRKTSLRKVSGALEFYHGSQPNLATMAEQLVDAANRIEAERAAGGAVGFGTIFRTRHYRWPALLSIVVWISMPLGGADVVQLYSTGILIDAGVPPEDGALYTALMLLLPSFFFCVAASLLVDRIGRRPLTLIGMGLMSLGTGLQMISGPLGSNTCSIIGLASILMGFSVGPGLLAPMLPNELCPSVIRGSTISLASGVTWVLSLSIVFGFPALSDSMGTLAFAPLFVCSTAFFIFTAIYLPETMNRTSEQLAELWRGGGYEEIID